MSTEYDVAVVGLGVLGSAAAYHAARRGVKVIGFEQFEFGHVRGASHDTSRIIRTSYEAPQYVALAKSAYKDWAALEEAAGQKLTNITGGLVFLPEGGPLSAESFATSLEQNDIPYELLTSEQVAKRWPQYNIADTVKAVYTADSGIVHAAKAVMALQHLARANGAELRELTPVTSIVPRDESVVIETPSGTFCAKKIILATDAWTNQLIAPLGVEIPLKVSQEQVTFVQSPKILKDLCSFLEDFIPDKAREPLRTVTCQYTITPDRQFILGALKKHPSVILALGAAHAFKFAPAIGRNLAELAIDGKSTDDLSKFGVPSGVGDD